MAYSLCWGVFACKASRNQVIILHIDLIMESLAFLNSLREMGECFGCFVVFAGVDWDEGWVGGHIF